MHSIYLSDSRSVRSSNRLCCCTIFLCCRRGEKTRPRLLSNGEDDFVDYDYVIMLYN